jgi:predicted DNA-binding protein (MmcQ/YjbR family)
LVIKLTGTGGKVKCDIKMEIEGIRKFCTDLPHVTEDIKWEHDLVFSVGGKMFCVVGIDNDPLTISFKVKDDEFADLSTKNNFKPAPYLARYKWVLLQDAGAVRQSDLKLYIKQSYELVKDKLPPGIKTRLGI